MLSSFIRSVCTTKTTLVVDTHIPRAQTHSRGLKPTISSTANHSVPDGPKGASKNRRLVKLRDQRDRMDMQ